jgi:hypothetical protein
LLVAEILQVDILRRVMRFLFGLGGRVVVSYPALKEAASAAV